MPSSWRWLAASLLLAAPAAAATVQRHEVRIDSGALSTASYVAAQQATDFVQQGFRADSGGEHVYFAPDADVLLDDAFASGYCFHIMGRNAARANQVGLGFRAADRRLLLQQRSATKKTWPLVWSNSCCGHPSLPESTVDAARRRIKYELGLEPTFLQEVLGYRYCFTKDGVMENEICPILVAIVETEPVAHPDEVHAVAWMTWDAFLEGIEQDPDRYSQWCI